ncbi:MAG: hypothetical protein LBC17_00540 [Lactobacillaceae bacterium]|jgi:hypothetical protein|nr:hypothetical protein [Lactobacillaceae bacterium]
MAGTKNQTGKRVYNSLGRSTRPVSHSNQKVQQQKRTAQLQQWAKGTEGVELPKAIKINA